MTRIVQIPLLILFLVVFGACVEDELPKARSIELVSGDNQSAYSSTVLPEPIVIIVTDQYGKTFQGASIEVYPTHGWVTPTTMKTNAEGEASVVWTLGSTSGEQNLTLIAVDENDQALNGAPIRVNATAVIDTLSNVVFVVSSGTKNIPGAKVYIDGNALRPTDSNGLTDTALVAGVYTYTVEAEGYASSTSYFRVNFNEDRSVLQSMNKLYALAFQVSDELGPVKNTQIKINGQGLAKTNDNGRVDTTIVSGHYYYEVEAEGYASIAKTLFEVNGDKEIDLILEKKRKIQFYVSDGQQALGGVSIRINGGGLYLTADDGYAEMALINGNYSFAIEKEGFEYTGDLSLEVTNADLEVPIVMDELFEIEFTITSNNRIVKEALIVFEDGKSCRTSATGKARLNLINGEYRYVVKADYYLELSDNILTVEGQNKSVEIQMPYISSLTIISSPTDTVLPINADLDIGGMCLQYIWSNGYSENVYDDAFESKGIVIPSAQVMGTETTVLKLSHKVSPLSVDQKFTNAKVIDIDNNTYLTTKIGNQIWMASDLKTSRYPNGVKIPYRQQGTSWYSLDNTNYEHACSRTQTDHDGVMVEAYVYSYAAAIAYNWKHDNVDGQGICPNGWHLPKNKEWDELKEYITNAGYRNKEAIALKSNNAWGAKNGLDIYGFNALPSQYLFCVEDDPPQGPFSNSWWAAFDDGASENEYLHTHALNWGVTYLDQEFSGEDLPKSYGFSVRCIQNQ